ncbi:MAG TPA: DUF1499 domain-containing protein [Vicinamibacteria bacterium]|jgi:uncharacterized protein (DUF1499 family)|nr:DUF1499 domain-containing protein [Vicinamibacteria bacterium]
MRLLKQIALLAAVGGALWVAFAFPRLWDVETDRTPEYPDLKAQIYMASEEKVAKGVKDAIARLPRWTLVGSGQGPGGHSLQAVHESRFFHFKDDVTIRVKREGGSTRVSVRSRSQMGVWDFGQNARNIQELLAELNREVL